ncbi:MurT ligase domain-containing protein [Microlunatus speluncae]|uniref:MurT ligase domain-containing protein n=1 Tax=Microlunatus speluncae TaxID=2594267 RepID=UPI00126681AE|nr:MurT ligase domain-containing protein [Microlunatus speluncae]
MPGEPDSNRTKAAHRGMPSAAASSFARFGVATLAGRLAAAATRFTRSDGPTVRGRVIRRVDPGALSRVVRRQPWVLVVGEYGTTVLSSLLVSAVRASHGTHETRLAQTRAEDGTDGVLSLLADRTVPELVVVAARPGDAVDLLATGDLPRAIVLFDSSGAAPNPRYAHARALHRAIGGIDAPVIANAVDPMTVLAAGSARRISWVRGDRGYHDQLLCPGCGSILTGVDDAETGWRCPRHDYRQPEPDYRVQDGKISDADGQFWDPRLPLPGRLSLDQACFALAAAETLGIHAGTVFVGMRKTRDALGRFGTVTIGETKARLIAARHPAEWIDALTVIDQPTVIIATDDTDLSWSWDCDPGALAGRAVIATGPRAPDVTARLALAGIDCRDVPDLSGALAGHRGGVDVLALPGAFRTLLRLSGRS